MPFLRISSVCILILACTATAQRPSRPSGPPTIELVAPLGAQAGTAVDAVFSGSNLANPLAILLADWARITIDPNSTTGKDSTKIRARIEVPADAPIGIHRVRLATSRGVSNSRAFCVDALPQISTLDTNHSLATSQSVAIPCVVVGRIDPETSNFFKFTAAEGQRLSFEVLSRRLGSPLDPILRLHDARTGKELPKAYSDDSPGLQADPRLTYTFAAAGEYVAEVRDATHRGGKEFWYRLRIGDFPCAVTSLPLAVKRGTKSTIQFAGAAVEGVAAMDVYAPTDPAIESISVAPTSPNGLPGWPVSVLLSDQDELLAGATIGTLHQAQRLSLPCGVTGRFLNKSQRDHYVVALKKGERLLLEVQASEFNSPAEAYMTVRDGAGKELARTDPQRDARIDFTAPADGDFFIVVEHLNYAFGPTEVYRLTAARPTPGFELALSTDRVNVPQGQPALIPITVLTRRDFGGPIEVSVVGPPGLTGSVTVPSGVQALPPAMGQSPPPPAAVLPIHAAADLAPGAYEIKVVAKGQVDRKELIAFASTRSAVQGQMAGLTNPPREWLRTLAVAVTPKPPFALSARWSRPESVRGLSTSLIVSAVREARFEGEINLSTAGLPSGVTAAAKTIPAAQSETSLELKIGENAQLGSFPFNVIGKGKRDDTEYSATLLPAPLVVAHPFDLTVGPNPLALDQGGTATLTIQAQRKGGYSGPIALEMRNLPAQVTATKATMADNQNSATITLTALAAAPLGSRGDVDVLGTAAIGNQQAASPTLTVRVQAPPPELIAKIDPTTVSVKPGEKAKIKVDVQRKNFAGPISITIGGLPSKVTAAPATIAADRSSVIVEISAAADAPASSGEAQLMAKGAASATLKFSIKVER